MTIGRKLPIAKYVAFLSLSVTQETTNPITHKKLLFGVKLTRCIFRLHISISL